MSTQSLREQAAYAAAKYDSLLRRMDEITDLMIAALAACDTDSALKLLDARSEICEEISACSQSLDSLMNRLESRDSGLETLLQQVYANLTNLSEKQTACETLMAARLNECRSELRALRRERGLTRAYRPSRQAKKAVFLDSKR
jgi:hypothetical protein